MEIPADAPVGVGVPCVVIDGVTKTAANIDAGWIDFDARAAIETAVKRPASILNDADAAGIAEMRFGAALGEKGVVFVLTLGTGVGSGVFNDGVLVPNTELGHMEIRGRDAERRSAAAARVATRAVVEGLGDRSRGAPPGDRQAVLAEPPHPRRRRQQAARPVHPAPERPAARRCGAAPERRGDRRGGDGRVGAGGPRRRTDPPADRRRGV